MQRRILLSILALFTLLCVSTILTLKPWCDEGYEAGAAMNLVNHGYLGVPSIEMVSPESYPGVDRHWYWQVPLYPVALAGWYVVTGQGIYQQRFFTLVQALVLLISVFILMRRMTQPAWLGTATVGVLSLDYFFMQRAADGRYDMLCASLGFAGLAAYMWLRERSSFLAVLAGSAGIVASVMTHPIGILFGFQYLYLIWRYDWPRFRWRWLVAAALPPLIAAALWGWYITQDPASFRAQFFHSTADRGMFMSHPLQGFLQELKTRYLFGLGGIGEATVYNPLRAIRGVVLAVYVGGLFFALFSRRLRSEWKLQPVVVLWAIASIIMLVLDSGTRPLYLLHVLPWLAALLAASFGWLWVRYPSTRVRLALGAVAMLFLAVQLGGIAYIIRRNNWDTEYRPVARYLQQNLKPGDSVLAGPELGYTLGFGEHLVDDPCLAA
jgi:4-amino-4-deoxy-L-arabinose transferase-like glycosyltransferase